ncbi:VanW family protein [Lysinibacillus contaminans]|uniref:VanW family protein n=1 Tax=Lysinibacillus contaminans TaxID=1293441 RepID=A0ABR5K5C7_9BACI|nr:VanW family protein [Lysinibacillus contaminans]KOS69840.1 VanW family protein [Lysinibacillus contaminans]
MKRKWMATLCLVCAIGLAGCQGKSEKEQALEKKVSELEQQIEEIQKPVTYEQEDTQEVVNIVDPNTMEIVHTLSPQDLGYEEDLKTYKKHIEQLAKELARGTEKELGYDQRMVLDRMDEKGQIINGSPMVLLKESELVEKILAVSGTGGNVEMPLYVTESGYYLEDIPYLEDVVVASYTTYFNTSDVGRNKNIELSAQAINNVIVGSGDQFSFNTVVGPRDEANGYQPAPEIINKKVVMGIGGGICQTSSTLFNAVDQVPIKMVERHHHSLDIGYVPKGRDATVSYGGLDFRFQNTSDVPFLIQAIYGKDFLTVEVRTSEKYEEMLKKTP